MARMRGRRPLSLVSVVVLAACQAAGTGTPPSPAAGGPTMGPTAAATQPPAQTPRPSTAGPTTWGLDPAGWLTGVARSAGGAVTGRYRDPDDPEAATVEFAVAADGTATFREGGEGANEVLEVRLRSDGVATLHWQGATIDGNGALEPAERAALLSYFKRDVLRRAATFIPLDIACGGPDLIDERQVAALLFPLQIHIKYLVADRKELATLLVERSTCRYGYVPGNESAAASVIQLSPAMPVPVVPGFFPLDEVGAIEASVPPASLKPLPAFESDEPVCDVYGPCESMCRGACGGNCEPNNCITTAEMRCDLDAQGRNTGLVTRVLIHDCGLHQGCIDHDACYDRCNRIHGCGTWDASSCMHSRHLEGMPELFEGGYCDQRAIEEYGVATAGLWVYGHGPQPMRQTYEYTDLTFVKVPHPEKCPVGQAGQSPGGGASPAPVATPAAMDPPAGPRWVLTGAPVTNVDGAPRVYRGGGSDPAFFPEARFEGTFTSYDVTATKIAMEAAWVDHGWEAYHVTIVSIFDAPPPTLIPGETYPLRVDFTRSGKVAEGGGSPGATFQYSVDRSHEGAISPAQPFTISPWSDAWNGQDYSDWVLTAPSASVGGTLTITAAWWNCPVCNVTWTYRRE